MKKLIFIFLITTLAIPTKGVAQSEQLEVEGAITIADSNSATPSPGTIRWTGSDFEGWTGSEWLSLTCCENPCSTSPIFLQSLPDLNLNANANCEATISVPFQLQYSNPINLSVSLSVTGPNAADASLSIINSGTNGSTINYILSGVMPFGFHTVTVLAEDSSCGLSSTESFYVLVVDSNPTPPTFQCKKNVKAIEDGPTPSVTYTSDEIVCVTTGSSCDPLAPTIISSFSIDPTDNVRVYDCSDLGDIQTTMFIFDVLDSDNDGVLDTIFREPCFAIQTIVDQNGFCNF